MTGISILNVGPGFIPSLGFGTFTQKADIPLQDYAPLAQGRVMKNAVLAEIAETHQTSAAAIAVAWLLHKPGVIALPKTAKPSRLAGNLAAAEIAPSPDQIVRIDAPGLTDRGIVAPEDLAPNWDD